MDFWIKNNALKKIALFLLLSSLLACVNVSDQSADERLSAERFFNLSDYFEEEIARLNDNKQQVDKLIEINGESAQETLDSIDYEKELAVFVNSGINKTSWVDKYQADSTFNDAGLLTEVVYTALDEDLKTQLLTVQFDNEEVQRIDITNRSGTTLAKMRQQLSYAPAQGYTIESQQDILLFDDRQMVIKADFVQ